MAEHEMPSKSSITQYNNSYAAKKLEENEEKTENSVEKVEKVITGRVISAKKTPGQKFKETFLPGCLCDTDLVPIVKNRLFWFCNCSRKIPLQIPISIWTPSIKSIPPTP